MLGSNAAILSDIKRAIASKGFIFGTLGMVLVIILSSLEAIITLTRFAHPLQSGYHAQFIMDALPNTTAFVDDIKKRVHKAVPASVQCPYVYIKASSSHAACWAGCGTRLVGKHQLSAVRFRTSICFK